MPRDLPVGNGQMLVAFDHKYQLREFFYPYVGQANHTNGNAFRFGVWVDGRLAWVDEDGWERSLKYEEDTLVTEVRLVHAEMQIALTCHDGVDLDSCVFVRRIDVENLGTGRRDVRLFFHQGFIIGGYREGDTAYYDPTERALIHYKGQFWFLVNAMTTRVWGLSSFATGVSGMNNAEGTWWDATDGALERNAIAQGSVDSTGSIHLMVDKTATAYYWICAGQDRDAVMELNSSIREQTPERVLQRVRSFWRQWVFQDGADSRLPEKLRSFYRRSLLVLRTQIDNRGAILAANDSDTLHYNRDSYSYLWPRDGALVAESLDRAGYHDVSARFFALCAKLLPRAGYFMHKYNPDGSIGSSWHPWCSEDGSLQLPIQEDETALVLYALWNHFEACRDIDFVRTVYGNLIEPAGDFLCSYRESRLLLPEASWDLWEERRGIHLFTVAATWAGLTAAANFAEMFGDANRARDYREAALEIRKATEEHLYDPDLGRFVRGLVYRNRRWEADYTLDSSQCGLFLFGMFRPDDPRVTRTMEAIEQQLWCKTPLGGIARYQRDTYYQIASNTDEVPGNPWFLCTLWLAQWYIATAMRPEDLDRPLELLSWVADHASASGVLAEQLNPHTGAQISVSPLTWSHATFVSTVCLWEERQLKMAERRRSTRKRVADIGGHSLRFAGESA